VWSVCLCASACPVCPVNVNTTDATTGATALLRVTRLPPVSFNSYSVTTVHKQQTTIRKPIECAPEASRGGREWAEMAEGIHNEVN
jgi:hypothetical protein